MKKILIMLVVLFALSTLLGCEKTKKDSILDNLEKLQDVADKNGTTYTDPQIGVMMRISNAEWTSERDVNVMLFISTTVLIAQG